MWFIRDFDRLKSEVEAIETLRDNNAWLCLKKQILKSLLRK